MVALAAGGHNIGVAFATAVALAGTAIVVYQRGRNRDTHACALDVATCSGLILLMAASQLTSTHGSHLAPSEHGLYHDVHAMVPGNADHALGLLIPGSVSRARSGRVHRPLW